VVNYKDLASGGLFMAAGLFFSLDAYSQLTIGTAFRMGPGYFPVMVGMMLTALGAAIIIKGIGHAQSPFGGVAWRGVFLLTISPVLFAVLIVPLGLIPTVIITVMLSAFASRHMSLLLALSLALGLTVFCVLVFSVGIGLPLRLLGPLLGF
jgi:hypothetical protein